MNIVFPNAIDATCEDLAVIAKKIRNLRILENAAFEAAHREMDDFLKNHPGWEVGWMTVPPKKMLFFNLWRWAAEFQIAKLEKKNEEASLSAFEISLKFYNKADLTDSLSLEKRGFERIED